MKIKEVLRTAWIGIRIGLGIPLLYFAFQISYLLANMTNLFIILCTTLLLLVLIWCGTGLLVRGMYDFYRLWREE